MEGFRVVWGPPWTPYPVHPGPPTGVTLDGVHCGPRSFVRFGGTFQHHDPVQHDPVDHGESVLAGAPSGLDQDALAQEVGDGALDRAFAKLRVPLDRALGTPDARTVIARLVGEEHDDLLARGAAEDAVGAEIGDLPAHAQAPGKGKRQRVKGGGSFRLTELKTPPHHPPKADARARKWFDNRPLSA